MSQDQTQSESQHEAVAVARQTMEDTEMAEAEDTREDLLEGQTDAKPQASDQAAQHPETMAEAAPAGTLSDTSGPLKHESEALEASGTVETRFDDKVADQQPATQVSEAQATSMPTTIAEPASDTPKASSTTALDTTLPGSSAANPVLAKVQSRPASRAASTAPSGSADHTTGKATGAPARIYLKEQVNDWLLEGMRWIAHTRPQNGLASLGQYLTSADQWRTAGVNQGKDASSFHKYWLSYQSWKEKNDGKTEADFQAASRT